VAQHAIGTTLTRSELEERTLALCRRAQLPAPAVNADVAGASGRIYTVDFLWPAQRVVLETDGHAYHRTRSAVERDRRREADLVTAGHRVLRGTRLAVEREPDRMAVMLRVALSLWWTGPLVRAPRSDERGDADPTRDEHGRRHPARRYEVAHAAPDVPLRAVPYDEAQHLVSHGRSVPPAMG
jgi:hypothetical protein